MLLGKSRMINKKNHSHFVDNVIAVLESSKHILFVVSINERIKVVGKTITDNVPWSTIQLVKLLSNFLWVVTWATDIFLHIKDDLLNLSWKFIANPVSHLTWTPKKDPSGVIIWLLNEHVTVLGPNFINPRSHTCKYRYAVFGTPSNIIAVISVLNYGKA